MKLSQITIIKPLKMSPVDSKYWKLTDDYAVSKFCRYYDDFGAESPRSLVVG